MLAIAVTPGGGTAVAWWLAGCALAAALAGLPLFVVGQQRCAGAGRRSARPEPAVRARSRRTAAARRLVAEAGLAAAAVGGIIVLRRQGLSPGSVDVYPSAAPVLVAILAAIVVVHGYPVVLRLLLRLARARPGVSAFVGLARATRTSPQRHRAGVRPGPGAGRGRVRHHDRRRGVPRPTCPQSWRQVGADALIDAAASPRPLSPAVQREIAAVPGAARTAAVLVTTGSLDSGAQVTVAVLDPSRYAALVARTPGPAFPAAALARPPPGRAAARRWCRRSRRRPRPGRWRAAAPA